MNKTIILAGVVSSVALANFAFAQTSSTSPMTHATSTVAPAGMTTSSTTPDYSKEKQDLLDSETKQVKQLQDIIDSQAKLLQAYQAQLDTETKIAKESQDLLDAQAKRAKRLDTLLTADEALIERHEKVLEEVKQSSGTK